MAPVHGERAAALASQPTTPIAQLGPDLPDQASRVVRGEITITWPYNSVTKTLAFLLAEPDVRLRRAKGQIRIELCGPSAKAASDHGLGAGDELLFSLDGAEWKKDESPGRIPGARVEWQLRFSEKLLLQVKSGESGQVNHINIDSPAPEQLNGPAAALEKPAAPEPEPIVSEAPSPVRKISDIPINEYPSPAFVKRARMSYGALFEGGFDIFEEDGAIKGRGRKRTRFGRASSAWRYSSQSPSPEPTSPALDAMEEDTAKEDAPGSSPTRAMTDEACQTVEVEMAEVAPKEVAATVPQRERTPVPPEPTASITRASPTTPVPAQADLVAGHQDDSLLLAPSGKPPGAAQEHRAVTSPREPDSTSTSTAAAKPQGPPAGQVIEGPQIQEQPSAEVGQASPSSTKDTEKATSALSGFNSLGSSFSSFGAGAPSRAESTLSLADQVRFGFSHVPQTTQATSTLQPESAPKQQPEPEPAHRTQDPYPASYLDDVPAPAKYADMDTYLNGTDEQQEMADHDQTAPPEPPVVESFHDGQWEMPAQSPHYNLVEGGHFGADALAEGTRLTAGQESLHAGNISPDQVPEGFASYGHVDTSDTVEQESPPRQEAFHDEEPVVENEDVISDGEVGVDDEEDEDAEADEYAYGERIEEGEYDQRNYDVPSDDEEGLSEEEDEAEMETADRFGDGEMYDEDGEGEEFDEEEEYESEEEYEDEEDYDASRYQPRRPAAPAQKERVVISLLSDSEDDDEPAAPPVVHAPDTAPSPARQPSPDIVQTVEADSKQETDSKRETDSKQETGSKQKSEPDHIHGRTDVFDFATLAAQHSSQKHVAPAANSNGDAGPSSSASQVPGSFALSSARDESYVPEPEAAPSGGSPEAPFVAQPETRSASSESSTEGLFISQPRARSPALADQQNGDALADAADLIDEDSTDGRTVSPGPEQAEDSDESMGEEKTEQDETETRSSEARDEDSDEILPDADDDLSFASQVEMADEELAESGEDENMDAEDAVDASPDAAADDMDMSGSEAAHDVAASEEEEEDADMIDVGPARFESASPEVTSPAPQPQQDTEVETTTDVSELVVREEVVSEVSVTAALDEPLPDVEASAQQEAGVASLADEDTEIAEADLQPEVLEDVRGDQEEAGQTDVSPVPGSEPPVGSAAPEVQKDVQESMPDAASAESRPGVEESPPAKAQANGTERAHPPEVDTAADAQAGEVIPGPSSSAKPLTVVRLDEISPDAQSAADPSSLDEEVDKKQQAAEEEAALLQPQEHVTTQQSTSATAEDLDDEAMLQEQLTQEQQQSFETESQSRTRSPSPDLSVALARQAVAAKRNKKAPEPTRTSSRVTRARSSSFRSNATNGTPEREEDEDNSASLARAALASPSRRGATSAAATATTEEDEEDTSVSLAREALASPSRRGAEPESAVSTLAATTTPTLTALKADLTKRLRTELPECVPLKSLATHVDKYPNALAVVTSTPTQPARAKGGPREYFMSFRVTDPSVAPAKVVEVQLYRPHKDTLPIVKPGDVVLLQRFQVKAISKKGWGFRTGGESAWAVWEEGVGYADVDGGEAGAPQIKGPPVEGWELCVGYVRGLREWFALLMGDAAAKGKLERADRKMVEAGGGGGGK